MILPGKRVRRPARATRPDLMDAIPRRLRRHETDGNGLVTILVPRFNNRLLLRYLQPRLPHPYFKLHLDELGSFVWLACDGQTPVRELGRALARRYGDDFDPGHRRLALFLLSLENGEHITYVEPEAASRVP